MQFAALFGPVGRWQQRFSSPVIHLLLSASKVPSFLRFTIWAQIWDKLDVVINHDPIPEFPEKSQFIFRTRTVLVMLETLIRLSPGLLVSVYNLDREAVTAFERHASVEDPIQRKGTLCAA